MGGERRFPWTAAATAHICVPTCIAGRFLKFCETPLQILTPLQIQRSCASSGELNLSGNPIYRTSCKNRVCREGFGGCAPDHFKSRLCASRGRRGSRRHRVICMAERCSQFTAQASARPGIVPNSRPECRILIFRCCIRIMMML